MELGFALRDDGDGSPIRGGVRDLGLLDAENGMRWKRKRKDDRRERGE